MEGDLKEFDVTNHCTNTSTWDHDIFDIAMSAGGTSAVAMSAGGTSAVAMSVGGTSAVAMSAGGTNVVATFMNAVCVFFQLPDHFFTA